MFDGGRMSHHGAYHGGSGEKGSYDAVSAFKAICKRVFVANHPAQAVQQAQLAVKLSMTGEPGPVAVILNSNALEETVGPGSFPRLYPSAGYVKARSQAIDQAEIDAAAAAISGAARPVLIAGHGVQMGQAYEELREFAHVADVPVVTTQGGKGVFDETDKLGAGVFGEWGKESANALVGAADCVVAVGTRLGPIDTVDQIPDLIDPTRQTLIQIDTSSENTAWTFPIDHAITGDAAAVLAALTRACDGTAGSRPKDGPTRIAELVEAHDLPRTDHFSSDEFPLRPERLVSLIQQEWPEDGIVVTDAGESRTYMLNWFESRGAGRYLVPHGGGGMGYAIAGAFGAKIAEPAAPVIGICGDGSFGMTMNTIMNGVQEKVPFAVVVFNNRALGWPLHVMQDENKKHFEFYDFDHAEICKAMGGAGKRCSSVEDVRMALREAVKSKVPYVIDVPITIDASFVDSTAKVAKKERERPFLSQAE